MRHRSRFVLLGSSAVLALSLVFAKAFSSWSASGMSVPGDLEKALTTSLKNPVAYVTNSISTTYSNSTHRYYDITSAIKAANSGVGSVVSVVPGNTNGSNTQYTIAENITINSGITLNIPYADGSTNTSNITTTSTTEEFAGSLKTIVKIADGITVKNNGTIELGGVVNNSGGGYPTVRTNGDFTKLLLGNDSRIVSTGTINCYGLIDCINTATDYKPYVILKGGSLNMPFTWNDFPGGSVMYAVYNEISTRKCAPIWDFYFSNVRTSLRVYGGSQVNGWVGLAAASNNGYVTMGIVSSSSSSIVTFLDDSSYLDANYNPANLKHTFNFVGNATFNMLNIDVEKAIKASAGSIAWTIASMAGVPSQVSTQDALFPLTYRFDINLLGKSKVELEINNSIYGELSKVSDFETNSYVIRNVALSANDTIRIKKDNKYIGYYGISSISSLSGFSLVSNSNYSTNNNLIQFRNNKTLDIYLDSNCNIILTECTGLTSLSSTNASFSTGSQKYKIMTGCNIYVGQNVTLNTNEVYIYGTNKYSTNSSNSSACAGVKRYKVISNGYGSLIVDGSLVADGIYGFVSSNCADATIVLSSSTSGVCYEPMAISGENTSASISSWLTINESFTLNNSSNVLETKSAGNYISVDNGDYVYWIVNESKALTGVGINNLTGTYASDKGSKGTFNLQAVLTPSDCDNFDSSYGYRWTVSSGGSLSATTGQSVTLTTTANSSTNPVDDVVVTLTVKDTNGTSFDTSASFTRTPKDAGGGSCVTGDALITLADGLQTRADNLHLGDMLKTWSFETGGWVIEPVIFLEEKIDFTTEIITLFFNDGSSLDISYRQSFFDTDLLDYFVINNENYQSAIGHHVLGFDDGIPVTKTIISITKETRIASTYEFITGHGYQFVANNILTLEAPINAHVWFTVNDDYKYDEELMRLDLETYGVLPYEVFAEYVTEEQYYLFNGHYLAVPIGKGYFTLEELMQVISHFIPGNT